MMPGCAGTDVCRKLRKAGYSGAIMMLTAKDSLQDRVVGLDCGADDYMVKPFEIEELLARMRALNRRNYAPIVGESEEYDDFVLERSSHSIRRGKEELLLSPREYQLLDLLLQNKGQTLPRELILDRVWGLDSEVSAKTVDATVKLLRKKLAQFDKQEMIQSIRGVGYKLEL
jgi:DNA-binding response OmpR family regulator